MLNQPNLSPVPEENKYVLLDDYEAKYGDIKIVVPGYFTFDGASIPFFGWISTYTPFHPDVMAAAIIHDWLYKNHQVDRKTTDRIFYDRLILNGANKIKSKLMYNAVKFAAGPCWGISEKEKKDIGMLYTLIKNNKDFEEYCFPEDVLADLNIPV